MLTGLANWIMRRRARRVFERLEMHLPAEGMIADIGSGTGHNGEFIRTHWSGHVEEFDVSDLHWVGPPPELFLGTTVPRSDQRYDAVMLLYVLHYPKDLIGLLREARRLTKGPILILQSTYRGRLSRVMLRYQEFFFGRFGYYLARAAGLLKAGECSLHPSQYFKRADLERLFAEAGLSLVTFETEKTLASGVCRDLYVLQRTDA